MSLPDLSALMRVCEATWPPAAMRHVGGWRIGDGRGGGKRVSAGMAAAFGALPDIAVAEAEMAGLGQPALFLVREGEGMLDQALADRGYALIDPVHVRAAPVSGLTADPAGRLSAFAVGMPPLAVMKEIWAGGGIGPARLAVMAQAEAPKTAILGRLGEYPAGAGYVAIHDGTAMVHAVEIPTRFRRQGVGRNIMRFAAAWAQDNGATHLAALATHDNAAANALYAALDMPLVGGYHYRLRG